MSIDFLENAPSPQSIIHKLTRHLLDRVEMETFLAQALPLAAEALSADHLHLWHSPAVDAPFTCTFILGTAPTTMELPKPVAQEVGEQQRPLLLAPLLPTLTNTDWLPPHVPHGLIVPVLAVQGQQQILCFYTDQPASLSDNDLLLAQEIADLLALATQQAHIQSVQQTIIGHAAHGLAIVQNGRIVYWNRLFAALLGEDWQTGHARRFWPLLTSQLGTDIPDALAAYFAQGNEGQRRPLSQEIQLHSRSGAERYLHLRAKPATYRDQPAYQLTLHDVTKKRHDLEAIQEKQTKLQQNLTIREQAIASSLIPFAISDLDGHLTYINQAFLQLWEYEEVDDLLGQSVLSFWETPEAAAAIVAHLAEHHQWQGELTARSQSGALHALHVSASFVMDAAGTPLAMTASFLDVTKQRQQQQALQISQTRLQAIVNNSQDAILVADDNGRYLEANPAALDMLGYSAEEIQTLSVSDVTGPTHQPHFDERWDDFVVSGQQTGLYSIVNRHGQTLEIEYRAVSNFLPGLHLAFLRDVTERRQQQLARQKLANALEQTGDTVIITDKHGVIEYVNPAFTAVTGYTQAEALGNTPALLKSGYHDDSFYQELWETILAGQIVRLNIVNRRKNGEWYHESRTITPLVNEEGEITHFIASGRDITEQREAEIALEQSAAFTRAILNSLTAHIAVLDKHGNIIATNESWKQFGLENGAGDISLITSGVNYLAICRQATGPFSEEGMIAYWGLTAVLANDIPQFDLEYPCPSPTKERWYLLCAVPFRDDSGRIIVTHTDITKSKLLERQLESVYQFGLKLITLQSETEILNRFLQIAQKLFSSDLVACGLIDKNQQELVYDHWISLPEIDCPEIHFPFTSETSLGVATIKENHPLYIPDADKSPYTLCARFDARSAYCVPLRVQEKIIGVIIAESQIRDGFTVNDRRFLNILTQQLGQALHNAKLFKREQQQTQNLALLYQASRTISSSLDLPQVLNTLLNEIKTLLAAKIVSTLLYDEEKDKLYFAAIVGDKLDVLDQVTLDPDNSIVGWVLRQQEAVLVEDVQQDPRFYQKIDELTGLTTHALLAAPLTVGPRKLGVVEVLSEEPGAFDSHQLQLLQSLSNNAAVAIENAHLFAAERQLKEHLQRSQAQLVQSEKMGALGRLTASIAHEINNPLQSVQGFLTLITENLSPEHESPKIRRYMGILEAEVERIAQLVKQMRDFYRPAQQEMEAMDIHQSLQNVLLLSRKRLEQQVVTVQTTWVDELPPILGNPDHVKQVFLNLLLNAVEAMPEGGTLQIKTSLSSLETATGSQPAIRVDFIDTGHGIEATLLPQLFEPFITTKKSGTGLGLSISYNIVEAHGGTMLAESVLGVGTTMSVLLPLLT